MKNKKGLHVSFYDEVFRFYFEIFLGFETIKEVRKCKIAHKDFWKVLDDVDEDYYKNSTGITVGDIVENDKYKSDVIFILIKPSLGISTELKTLTHETLHATIHVLRERGITTETKTDEIFCYYQEMIMDKVLQKYL